MKRFDQVVVGTCFKAFEVEVLSGARRQQNDGNAAERRLLPQTAQQSDPVESGQHDIAKDKVWRTGLGGLECRNAIGRQLNGVAFAAQQSPQILAHVAVVFYEKDSNRGR